MKAKHILMLVIIALGIGIVVSSMGNASTYVTFVQAKEMAANGDNDAIHVVGELKKDAAGQIVGMNYDPITNPNRFEFMMVDSLQNECLVVYGNPKPADLDKSEKVVIVGKYEKDYFYADEILLKCPSKYNSAETIK
jgi:cytochrome c-type biogenesis protein CcmE